MDILAEIRKKNRDQWVAYAKDLWTDFRIWIQENGEIAAASALVSGVVIVLCFKLVFVLGIIACLAAFMIWQLAYPAGAETSQPESRNSEVPPTQH